MDVKEGEWPAEEYFQRCAFSRVPVAEDAVFILFFPA